MKKLIAVIVLLIAIILIASCGCAEADMDYSGTWYPIKYVKGDLELDAADEGYNQVLAFYPTQKAMILRESGKYQEGQWSDHDRYIMLYITDDKTQLFTKEGNYLTQISDGGTLWFKRETGLQEPQDVIQSSEEEFYGIWKLDRISNNGVLLSLKMARLIGTNASGSITISKDNAYLELDFGQKPITWDGQPTYSDGRIYFNTVAFTMTDTDELYLSSENTQYYFRKVKPVEGWFCSSCGSIANGNYCSNCGKGYNSSKGNDELEYLFSDNPKDPGAKFLYLGEYIIGTDLQPGVYVLSATELEYDWLWEVNKAVIQTYDYVAADRDWIKNDSQSVNKKGQKIRLTLEEGQKIKVGAGAFEIVEFTYRAPSETKEDAQESDAEYENVPWFDTGVGSRLPKPFSVTGSALKSNSLANKNNDDKSFYITLNATKKDYDHYKNVLVEWGFNEIEKDSELFSNSEFIAYDKDKYKVTLVYSSLLGMGVRIEAPDQ